jgi:hypothetical protein
VLSSIFAWHGAVAHRPQLLVDCLFLQVPEGYDATYKHFAAQGARVIALARRQLPTDLSMPELRALSREDVEADMNFQGFAVFQVRCCQPAIYGPSASMSLQGKWDSSSEGFVVC